MSDLPMTPVWGKHGYVIRSGAGPGVFAASEVSADAAEHASHTMEKRTCYICMSLDVIIAFFYLFIVLQFQSCLSSSGFYVAPQDRLKKWRLSSQ